MVPNPCPSPKPSHDQPSHNQASVPVPKIPTLMTRKAPGPKASDKRKRTMLTKRRYKVRVLTQPINPTHPPLHLYPHGSHCLHPNTSSKVHCRVYTGNGKQIGNRKICISPISNSMTPE